MQPNKTDSLTKLLERKQRLEQQITNAKSRLKKVDRAADTRRKILIGAYFLEVKYKGKEDELTKMMEGFLVRDNDRALFNLPPKGNAS
jgi:chaperonin cofactor prefoldin